MFFGVSIGIVDSSKGRGVDNIEVSYANGVATAFYTPLSGELNKPPIIDDLVISANGPLAVGTTLTATITGRVNGPFTEGTHVYQWYRLSARLGGTLTAIGSATNSTYTLQAADVGYYIVCAGRYGQNAGGNPLSVGGNDNYFYSEETVVIESSGAASDIVFAWEDYFDFESGLSSPANANTVGEDVTYDNLGTGEDWTGTALSKPTFSTDKLVFLKANSNKIIRPSSVTSPPKFEMWIKAQFTDTGGNMVSFGSHNLLGINSSTQYTAQGMTSFAGDLNEHVFRIVRNGASSLLQIDGGTEVAITDGAAASFLLMGTNYTGGAPCSFNLKKFWRTPYNTFLTTTQRDNRWAYFGF